MALQLPAGGAGRDVLMDALARLRRKHAGDAERRAVAPPVEGFLPAAGGGDRFAALLAGLLPVPGVPPATQPTAAPSVGGALGPYNTAGDGGAWGPTGINLYNPNLARGDMPAPGPGWILDNYGTPFWRRDFDPARPGSGKVLGEN